MSYKYSAAQLSHILPSINFDLVQFVKFILLARTERDARLCYYSRKDISTLILTTSPSNKAFVTLCA